jgi:hypothetical protein
LPGPRGAGAQYCRELFSETRGIWRFLSFFVSFRRFLEKSGKTGFFSFE